MERFKPKELMVAAINLTIDRSVKQCINDLEYYQARDKRIKKLIQSVKQDPKSSTRAS
jgi:Txe/YoeB family toxin of Txe-Axe toxin-antitoxin module